MRKLVLFTTLLVLSLSGLASAASQYNLPPRATFTQRSSVGLEIWNEWTEVGGAIGNASPVSKGAVSGEFRLFSNASFFARVGLELEDGQRKFAQGGVRVGFYH